jgi:hypothetical protein
VLSATQASLAQLVERGTSNAEVTGSTPLGGSAFCSFFALCQTHIALCLLNRNLSDLQGWLLEINVGKDKAGGLAKR